MNGNENRELILEGCTPTPLASYLKALGVLRLVGEQKPDWRVRGAWRKGRFVLSSAQFSGDAESDRRLVQSFFLNEYRPTSIVAPWNGGSGFFPKDNRVGIEAIARSRASRFFEYRAVILFCRNLLKRYGLKQSPKNEAKATFLNAVRAEGPETLLAWMDAAILLAGEDPKYPPLLGTGGNDGRLDFTNNFMQRVTELIAPATGQATELAQVTLPAALFGAPAPSMVSAAIGQFHPGGVGGPNASAGYEADSLMNPWDFVLMLEGALLFAASATRRLEAADPGMLAYPFTVHASGAGNGALGSTDETLARAEMWMPLWGQLSSAAEIKTLLAEGRATLGRRPVRDGIAFVRAVARLGVNRGITSFQRFGFLRRSGKAYLATPLTRVQVSRNPDADLIDELERGQFLDRLRRFARDEQAPARIRSQVRQLEEALFELAQESDALTLQKVLIRVGALSYLLGKSRKGQEVVPAAPTLSENWVLKADDASPEFRIASALAGLDGGLPMRPFLIPVAQDKYDNWSWNPESRLAVWGEGGFARNLGHVIARRRLEADRLGLEQYAFRYAAGVTSGDIAAWLVGQLDETRLSALLLGLVHTRIPANLPSQSETAILPVAYAVLKPFFAPVGLLSQLYLLPPDCSVLLPGELISKLRTGSTRDVQKAVEQGWRWLRAAGFRLPSSPRSSPTVLEIDGSRLLAALAIPLEASELARCLSAVTRNSFADAV